MTDWMVPAGLGVLAVLCVLLAVALLRTRARTRRDLEAARAEAAALRTQIEQIEKVLSAPSRRTPRVQEQYTITNLGADVERAAASTSGTRPAGGEAPRIDQALFADLVLRETVVRAASLAHGVRRALAPETRNRIRFEVKREIRRARKQRRADLKEARRAWEAQQRQALGRDDDESAA